MITIYGLRGDVGDVVKVEGAFIDKQGATSLNALIDASHHYIEFFVGHELDGVIVSFGVSDLNDGWCAAIELVEDETTPIPWPVRIETRGASPAVVIDCPPATHVSWIKTEKLS